MDYIPPEFAAAPIGSKVESACSPKVEDARRFRGIVISMPQGIVPGSGEKPVLPICGWFQLPSLPLVQGAMMVVHLRGVMGTPVPPTNGTVVITEGENAPVIPMRDPVPLDPRRWARKVSASYFHLDGQRYFKHQLPPGRYELFVSYGEAQSNVVRFEVLLPRPAGQ